MWDFLVACSSGLVRRSIGDSGVVTGGRVVAVALTFRLEEVMVIVVVDHVYGFLTRLAGA